MLTRYANLAWRIGKVTYFIDEKIMSVNKDALGSCQQWSHEALAIVTNEPPDDDDGRCDNPNSPLRS